MGDWKRSTRECSLNDLPPQVTAAIKSHIEQYNLGEILSDASLNIENKSEKIKKGLFGSAGTVFTHVILTPRWLVWTIQDGKDGISAVSARLADIVVTDYAKGKMTQLVPDTGLEVTGEFTGLAHALPSEQRGSIFIGLGPEPAAQKCHDALIRAVQDAKK